MAETKTYGEVLPCWWLVQATKDGHEMKAGDYGLVVCNDPDYIWSGTPRKDPSFGMTDEEFDNMSDDVGREWDDFMDYVDELRKHFNSDPMTGYSLVTAAKEAGWDRETHGFLLVWLSHRMAEVIERNPTADEAICERFALEDEKTWGYKRDEHNVPRKHQDG
jgi:hypothetical protein